MDKSTRRFWRRIRASTFSLKCGSDMGIYNHFVGPIKTPKLSETLKRFVEDHRKTIHIGDCQETVTKHFWELS